MGLTTGNLGADSIRNCLTRIIAGNGTDELLSWYEEVCCESNEFQVNSFQALSVFDGAPACHRTEQVFECPQQ